MLDLVCRRSSERSMAECASGSALTANWLPMRYCANAAPAYSSGVTAISNGRFKNAAPATSQQVATDMRIASQPWDRTCWPAWLVEPWPVASDRGDLVLGPVPS